MLRAYIVLTDSGGLQEEAVSLRRPVLVLRDVTERAEAVEVGAARLVGTSTHSIFTATNRLLDDTDLHRRMCVRKNPFGDGHASARIAARLGLTSTRQRGSS